MCSNNFSANCIKETFPLGNNSYAYTTLLVGIISDDYESATIIQFHRIVSWIKSVIFFGVKYRKVSSQVKFMNLTIMANTTNGNELHKVKVVKQFKGLPNEMLKEIETFRTTSIHL